MTTKLVGQTKDVGFQIGVRRTYNAPFADAWSFMFSEQGLAVWLGRLTSGSLEKGQEYRTAKGTRGKIRVFTEGSHIRMSWQPRGWENESTLQIRVIPSGKKTVISFHQEKLTGPAQREEMKKHWEAVSEKIRQYLEPIDPSATSTP